MYCDDCECAIVAAFTLCATMYKESEGFEFKGTFHDRRLTMGVRQSFNL